MGDRQTSQPKGSRRVWTNREEDTLLTLLEDAVNRSMRCDNGTFKAGTLVQIKKSLNEKCPNSNLRYHSHIESRMRKWRKTHEIIYDMINKSGFGWNDAKKCIEVDSDEVWEAYVQHNKDAEGMRGKSIPIYKRLQIIFGKDRATGREAQTRCEMANEVHIDDNEENEVELTNSSSSSLPKMNSTSTVSISRVRKRSPDGSSEMAKVFKEAVAESIEQLKAITASFVKGPEDGQKILAKLGKMNLSLNDQIDTLNLILEKPHNERTFITLEGSMREEFVHMLLARRSRVG